MLGFNKISYRKGFIMEKQNKVRITCMNCLYSKLSDRIESDPETTRIIITESCNECCVESSGIIQYFNSNMMELEIKDYNKVKYSKQGYENR